MNYKTSVVIIVIIVISGSQDLVAEANEGWINDGMAAITCYQLRSREPLLMRRVYRTGIAFDIIRSLPNGTYQWLDFDLGSRSLAHLTTNQSGLFLAIYIYLPKCNDEGIFRCVAAANTSKERFIDTRLAIKAASTVELQQVPRHLRAGSIDQATVVCDADLGYPPGNVSFSLTYPNGTENVVAFHSSRSQVTNCLKRIIGRYDVSAAEVINGTRITCRIRNSTLGDITSTSSIFLLPADVCAVNSSRVTYPYDCRFYVSCADPSQPGVVPCPTNTCFDENTLECSQPSPTLERPGLCPPSGEIYLPDPHLCDKFLHCSNGVRRILYCSRGFVYQGGSNCTSDILKARCYLMPNRIKG